MTAKSNSVLTGARSLALVAALMLAHPLDAQRAGVPVQPCNVVPPAQVVDTVVSNLAAEAQLGEGGRLQVGGNVTNIVRIHNHTSCRVRVTKGLGREVIDVRRNSTYFGHMWVPWADAFHPKDAITIELNGRPYFWIWQRSSTVRFFAGATYERASQDASRGVRGVFEQAFTTARNVPGLNGEGGPRILHIGFTREGYPYFAFAGVPVGVDTNY